MSGPSRTIPSVREILILHSVTIGADLLRRQPDGNWPERPMHIETGSLTLESIALELALSDLYASTRLAPRRAPRADVVSSARRFFGARQPPRRVSARTSPVQPPASHQARRSASKRPSSGPAGTPARRRSRPSSGNSGTGIAASRASSPRSPAGEPHPVLHDRPAATSPAPGAASRHPRPVAAPGPRASQADRSRSALASFNRAANAAASPVQQRAEAQQCIRRRAASPPAPRGGPAPRPPASPPQRCRAAP